MAAEPDLEAADRAAAMARQLLDDGEDDVQFTEADMRDPELLKELRLLGGDVDEEPEPAGPSIEDLEKQVKSLKVKAVTLKKEGDKAGALSAFKEAKTIEAEIVAKKNGMATPAKPQPQPQQPRQPQPQPQQKAAPTAQPNQAGAKAQAPAPKQTQSLPALDPNKPLEDDDLDRIRHSLQELKDDDVDVEVTEADMADPNLNAELDAILSGNAPPPVRTQSAPVPAAGGAHVAGGVGDDEPTAEELARELQGCTGAESALDEIRAELKAAKTRAVAFKKAGKKAEALAEMKKVRELTEELKELEDLEKPVPAEEPLPDIPIEELMRQEEQAKREKQRKLKEKQEEQKRLEEQRAAEAAAAEAAKPKGDDQLYAEMEEQLTHQVEVLKSLAKAAYDIGDKQSAVSYHKQRKDADKDLISLRQARMAGLEIPQFHHEDRVYKYERVFTSLTDVEMSVEVIRCIGLKLPPGYTELSPYVNIEHPHPNAKAGPKAYTPYGKGVDPVFDFSTVFVVERKRLDRKKVVFEAFQWRLLRSPLSLGRAVVPLTALLKEAETHEVVDLYAPGTRKSLGKIEYRIRIRTALSGPDMREERERWLVIDEYCKPQDLASLGAAHRSPSQPAPTPHPTPQQTHSAPTPAPAPSQPATVAQSNAAKSAGPQAPSAASPASKAPPAATPAKAASAPAASAPKTANAKAAVDTDDELYDPNSVDHMVSNSVLEWQMSLFQKEIAALKAGGKPVPEDLTFQMQNCQIKMDILVVKVQTGQLTVPMYKQQLLDKIEEEKKLALKFKKQGKMEWAMMAMKRVNIMKAEIKETLGE